MKFVFGPVPSRRLGNSLGIDIVPSKTCSLNCLYCECGRTDNSRVRRQSFFPVQDIIQEVEQALRALPLESIDYLTFSGSGEPTLNADLEEIITRIKQLLPLKVAVITNSTLLHNRSVRRALNHADLVMPTLSTVFPQTFKILHRPVAGSVTIEKIISGLRYFSRNYAGFLSIEIFLVPGINDSRHEMEGLIGVLRTVSFREIYLSTLSRPGSEPAIKSLSQRRLQLLAALFPKDWTVKIAGIYQPGEGNDIRDYWITWKEMLLRRSVSLSDLAKMSGKNQQEVYRQIASLAVENGLTLQEYRQNSQHFLRLRSASNNEK